MDKPEGIPTHKTDHDQVGFVEWMSYKLGYPLLVVHRLDRDTSGAIVFAKNKDAARFLTVQFETHAAQKTYIFLSHKMLPPEATGAANSGVVVRTVIEKDPTSRENKWMSHLHLRTQKGYAAAHPNSETVITFLKQVGPSCYAYEAQPKTGKTHQIRLHARDLGIPILGDTLYGGEPASRLMLHAKSLSLTLPSPATHPLHIESASPSFFALPEIVAPQTNSVLADMTRGWERRKRLFSEEETSQDQALRFLHQEGHDLRVDRLGPVAWGMWYGERPPSQQDLAQFAMGAQVLACAHWALHWMKDRGQNDYKKEVWKSPDLPDSWIAKEGPLQFEFRSNTGSSSGLFLDQRANRRWVQSVSQGLRVLNLFSYTGGFSVAAARGMAQDVVTVDTSGPALEWSKTNFQLNKLDPSKFEFFKADSFFFLDRTAFKGRVFDLVICDPPSFSRGPERVFKIEKDYGRLIEQLVSVTAPGGRILFSTNYEGWAAREFQDLMAQMALKWNLTQVPAPTPELDYEMPHEEKLLKSVIFVKGS